LEEGDITRLSFRVLSMLCSAYNTGQPNVVTESVGNSFERFDGLRDYVYQIGRIPGCLILLLESNGLFSVVDGHHRIAVYFLEKERISIESPLMWIGRAD